MADRPGQRDARADQGVVAQPGGVEGLIDQPPGDGQAFGTGVPVRQFALAGADDVVSEVAEQDPDEAEAELDPRDRAGPRVERQAHARPPGAGPLSRLVTPRPDDDALTYPVPAAH